MSEQKKMSNAKVVALVISIGLHAGVAYYLGSLALDYALPKGEVSSIEMNIDMPKGETTEVAVVEKTPPPPAPTPVVPPKPKVIPKPVATKPESKPLPKDLPTKEPVVEDKQGEMPVATEIPETPPQVEPIPEEPVQEAAAEPTPEAVPAPQVEPTPVPTQAVAPAETQATGPTATEQGYGTPVGNPEATLIPQGSNKSHTYPYMARLRKLEGVSIVQYTVSPTGDVTETKILQSSGHSVLDGEAVDAIKKWKFKPMSSEVVYEKEVVFRLKGEAEAAPSKLRRLEK
ncbi:MAG: energy transducer TonB [Bdellovibrionota bacterium]